MESTTTRKTFKFKLYKNSKKNRDLNWQLKIAHEIYNHCIALHKNYYKFYKKSLNRYKLSNHVTKLKKRVEFSHWNELGSQAIQEIIERIDKGYKTFFKKKKSKRVGRPSFKKREKYKSFTLKQCGWKLIDNKIRINKKIYGLHKSREVLGNIKTVTLKKDCCGDWWVCFSCENVPIEQIKACRTGKTAAFDFGLKTFLKCSEQGNDIQSPEFLKHSLKEMKILGRKLSLKKKGSTHRKASKLSLAKLHRKISNQRSDFFFKTARSLIQNYDHLGFEDLNLVGMQKIWGRKVSDLALGNFMSILESLALNQNGFQISKCGRFEKTTGVCPDCGQVHKLELWDRMFTCTNCGVIWDRDYASSLVIKKKTINSEGTSSDGVENVRRLDLDLSAVLVDPRILAL